MTRTHARISWRSEKQRGQTHADVLESGTYWLDAAAFDFATRTYVASGLCIEIYVVCKLPFLGYLRRALFTMESGSGEDRSDSPTTTITVRYSLDTDPRWLLDNSPQKYLKSTSSTSAI